MSNTRLKQTKSIILQQIKNYRVEKFKRKNMEFQLNLSLTELRKRTNREHLRTIPFLSTTDSVFSALNDNDKKILALLDRAGRVFDTISLKQDNKYNIDFLKFLNSEIKKGNEKAELTKILFDAQKGIFSPDYEGQEVRLAKNIIKPLGLNFYPETLDTETFHIMLGQMLDNGEVEAVQNILSQRTMVRIKNDKLIGIDYVDYFKKEFTQVADYLLQASKLCDRSEKQFAKFLKLQAKALLKANPKLDAKADILWAKIVNSKFEFTITRECYDDKMSTTILENAPLLKRLQEHNITIHSKDSLGARVGLVNIEGTKTLHELQGLKSIAEEFMPYKEHYSNEKKKPSRKQTALDVDIVNLYGSEGEFRAGIVLAQNLPNNDKLALKMGGGRKNIYHRQVRLSKSSRIAKKLLDNEMLKYYNLDSRHLGTICHENTHSLGPNPKTLGKYSSIIEEFKADMGMFAFLKEFIEAGVFTETQAKEIIVSDLTDSFLRAKPKLSQAHKVRTVMILNRFLREKALKLNSEQKLEINFDLIISTSKKMMAEIIALQLKGSIEETRQYIKKYFVWTSTMEKIATIQKTLTRYLNGKTSAPLSDKLNRMRIK